MTSPFRKLNHDEPEFADSKPIPDYCLIIEVMAYLEIRREDTKMKAKFVRKYKNQFSNLNVSNC